MNFKPRIVLLFVISIAIGTAFSQAQSPSHFYGTIGEFPIEAELSNQDGKISGWYWYPNKSKKLNLEGHLGKDSVFRLKESNANGALTGVFNGSFSSDYISRGVWYSGDMSKEFNFVLKLDNNVSLFTGRKLSAVIDNTTASEGILFQNSKVKGYSKLALWVTILLVIGLIGLALYLYRLRVKLKEKPTASAEKVIEKEIHYVNDSTEYEKQTSEVKGDMFQRFVIEMFHNKHTFFKWLDAAPDKMYGDLYPEANMRPDLIMRFKNESRGLEAKFAVECKYRAGHKDNLVFIDEHRKLDNYRKFKENEGIETFLVLGFGGNPDSPKNVFVLPIDKVKENMSLDELQLFENRREYFFYDYNEASLK